MRCGRELGLFCLFSALFFAFALGPVQCTYSQEVRYSITASELTAWMQLVENSISECKSLRAQFQLLRAASGNVTGLSQVLEERLQSLENYVSELENSNAKLIKLSQQARQELTDLQTSSKILRDEFDAYKLAVARIEIVNVVLWWADLGLGGFLIVYGLATGDIPLVVTGATMAGAAGLHFVFDLW